MRIAIYHNLPSGGAKRALFEMTRRLALKHDIDVYTLSCAEHDFCDLRPYCQQHIVVPFEASPLLRHPFGRLNQGIRALDLMRLGQQQQDIARRIDAASYDVVFAHACQFGQAPAILRFLRTASVYYCQEPPRLLYEPRIPRPYTEHLPWQQLVNRVDPFPRIYRSSLLNLDRGAARSASLVLANSYYSRESLYRTYGLLARVCYLGVDMSVFRSQGLPKQDFVLSVGALTPSKGFDLLIQSLALLDFPLRPALVIVSNQTDTNELVYLKELANHLHVSVDFHSRIDDQDLVRLYNQARLTLYAPTMEPFGFVPLESMACGTPVIGVREGGVRETIVHGVTGLLVDRDPAPFAQAIHALLADPDRAGSMGSQGRMYVHDHWTWEQAIARLESHLVEAADTSARGGPDGR